MTVKVPDHDVREDILGALTQDCLGQALARMEMSVALPAVHRRLPDVAFAGPPVRIPGIGLRRFRSVPMALAGNHGGVSR